MENNGWSLWHEQSVTICKAVLVRQEVKMVIGYSRSALSLQLNGVKLAIICYLLMIRWQLTAVNEQKLQFFAIYIHKVEPNPLLQRHMSRTSFIHWLRLIAMCWQYISV